MKKINIVKSNLEFNNIIHKGNKYVSNIFYTYVLINNYNYNRYGIAISTKIGNAVIRNKLKIKASINNSKIFKDIQEEYGTFYNYLKARLNLIVPKNKKYTKDAPTKACDNLLKMLD